MVKIKADFYNQLKLKTKSCQFNYKSEFRLLKINFPELQQVLILPKGLNFHTFAGHDNS